MDSGGEVFRRWWGLHEVTTVGAHGGWDQFPYKKGKKHQSFLSLPWEGTARKCPSARQGESPQQKLNLQTPWSGTCSLQTVRNKCLLLSRPVCGTCSTTWADSYRLAIWRPRCVRGSYSSITLPLSSKYFFYCWGRERASKAFFFKGWPLDNWLLSVDL